MGLKSYITIKEERGESPVVLLKNKAVRPIIQLILGIALICFMCGASAYLLFINERWIGMIIVLLFMLSYIAITILAILYHLKDYEK